MIGALFGGVHGTGRTSRVPLRWNHYASVSALAATFADAALDDARPAVGDAIAFAYLACMPLRRARRQPPPSRDAGEKAGQRRCSRHTRGATSELDLLRSDVGGRRSRCETMGRWCTTRGFRLYARELNRPKTNRCRTNRVRGSWPRDSLRAHVLRAIIWGASARHYRTRGAHDRIRSEVDPVRVNSPARAIFSPQNAQPGRWISRVVLPTNSL